MRTAFAADGSARLTLLTKRFERVSAFQQRQKMLKPLRRFAGVYEIFPSTYHLYSYVQLAVASNPESLENKNEIQTTENPEIIKDQKNFFKNVLFLIDLHHIDICY